MQNRGFAIVLDALMAIILVTALIIFLSQQPEIPTPGIDTSQRLRQISSSAFASLDSSGVLGNLLIERVFDENTARDLNAEAKKLVPSNVDLKIKITAFEASDDITYCRNQRRFEACFSPGKVSIGGHEPPQGKEVVYGKRVLAIRQPASERRGMSGETLCTLEGTFAPQKEKKVLTALLQDKNEISVEFKAAAFSNGMACAEETPHYSPPDSPPAKPADYSTVTLSARNQTRNPLDVYLVLDRSGSMSTYDMNLGTQQEKIVSDGTCNDAVCTSTGIFNTNCGYGALQIWARACGPVENNKYSGYADLNIVTMTNEYWEALSEKGTGFSKLFFMLRPISVIGVCKDCPADHSASPQIKVQYRPDGGSSGSYLSYDTGYTVKPAVTVFADSAAIGVGGQFDVNGWNTDPNAVFDVILFYTPKTSVSRPGSIGVNPTGPEIQGCDFAPDNFVLIDSLELPEDIGATASQKILRLRYTADFSLPSDACSPRLRITLPNDVNLTSGICPKTGTCNLTTEEAGYSEWTGANPIPDGTVKIWAAVDRSTILSNRNYFYVRLLDYVYGFPNQQQFDGGKCNGVKCRFWYTTPPNCNSHSIDQSTSGNYSYSTADEYTAGTIKIDPGTFLRGLTAKINFKYQDGNCLYGGTGFLQPNDSSWHFSSNVSGTKNWSWGINNPGTDISLDQEIPLEPGDYNVLAWADGSGSPAMASFFEQRMDAAQFAASRFIDNTNWKREDTIGLITFSDEAEELNPLLSVDDFSRGTLKQSMNGIQTGGETNIAAAIEKAHERLAGIGTNQRQFIILLSDGLANLPQENPLGLAIEAATAAYNPESTDHIITYTIAFGIDAIELDSQGAWKCKDPLTQIATAGGGKCYPANDPEQLAEIYSLIASQIQQELGQTDLEMPLYQGQLINNPRCGKEKECNLGGDESCPKGIFLRTYTNEHTEHADRCWYNGDNPFEDWHLVSGDESLVFKDILINQIGSWWDGNFDVAIPCNADRCFDQLIFPPVSEISTHGTKVTISQPPAVVKWSDDNTGDPEQQIISIRNRDLAINFVDGNIFSGKTNLHIKLSNVQDLNMDAASHQEPKWLYITPPPCDPGQVEVRLFQNASGESPDFNLSPAASVCVTADSDGDGKLVPLESVMDSASIENGNGGYIFAVINPDRGINPVRECKEHNWDKILCFAEPSVKFFILEYWSWFK